MSFHVHNCCVAALQDDRTFDIVPGGFDLQNGRGLVPSNTYMPRRRCASVFLATCQLAHRYATSMV